MTTSLPLYLCVPLLCAVAAQAQAQDYTVFHSPSGNIQCAIFGGDFAGARCDISELTPSFTQRPEDCDLDWGASFAVEPKGRNGYVACVGDTVADPSGSVLDYGAEISLFGITCRSEQNGMICTNRADHGFVISKAQQTVF